MPNPRKYQLINSDGKKAFVDADEFDNDIEGFINEYPDASIRMIDDNDGSEYHVPLKHYSEARADGVRGWTFDPGNANNEESEAPAGVQQVADPVRQDTVSQVAPVAAAMGVQSVNYAGPSRSGKPFGQVQGRNAIAEGTQKLLNGTMKFNIPSVPSGREMLANPDTLVDKRNLDTIQSDTPSDSTAGIRQQKEDIPVSGSRPLIISQDQDKTYTQRRYEAEQRRDPESAQTAEWKDKVDAEKSQRFFNENMKPVFYSVWQKYEDEAKQKTQETQAQMQAAGRGAPTTAGAGWGFMTGAKQTADWKRITDPQKVVDETMASFPQQKISDFITREILGDQVTDDSLQQDAKLDFDYIHNMVSQTPDLIGRKASENRADAEKYSKVFDEEYRKVAERMQEYMFEEYRKMGAPKNWLQYIISDVAFGNILAQVYDTMTSAMAGDSGVARRLRNEAIARSGEEQSMLTRAAAGTAKIALDSALGGFKFGGIIGNELWKLGAAGALSAASGQASRQGVNALLRLGQQKLGYQIAQSVLTSGASFAGYGMLTEGLAQAQDIQSAGYYGQDQDFDFKSLLATGGTEFLKGGALGAFGIGAKAFKEGYTGIRRAARGAAATAGEIGLFTGMGVAEKALKGENIDLKGEFIDNAGVILGLKMSHFMSHPKQAIADIVGNQEEAVKAGRDVRSQDMYYLKKAGIVKSDSFDLSAIGELTRTEEWSTNTPDGEQRSVTFPVYDELMQRKDVPWETKDRVTMALFGVRLQPKETGMVQVVQNKENGAWTVERYTPDNVLVDVEVFNSENEARSRADNLSYEAASNSAGAAELLAVSPARALKSAVYETAREFGMTPEEVNDVYLKVNAGSEDETERKIANNVNRRATQIGDDSGRRAIVGARAATEIETGMDLNDIFKKDYSTWTPEERHAMQVYAERVKEYVTKEENRRLQEQEALEYNRQAEMSGDEYSSEGASPGEESGMLGNIGNMAESEEAVSDGSFRSESTGSASMGGNPYQMGERRVDVGQAPADRRETMRQAFQSGNREEGRKAYVELKMAQRALERMGYDVTNPEEIRSAAENPNMNPSVRYAAQRYLDASEAWAGVQDSADEQVQQFRSQTADRLAQYEHKGEPGTMVTAFYGGRQVAIISGDYRNGRNVIIDFMDGSEPKMVSMDDLDTGSVYASTTADMVDRLSEIKRRELDAQAQRFGMSMYQPGESVVLDPAKPAEKAKVVSNDGEGNIVVEADGKQQVVSQEKLDAAQDEADILSAEQKQELEQKKIEEQRKADEKLNKQLKAAGIEPGNKVVLFDDQAGTHWEYTVKDYDRESDSVIVDNNGMEESIPRGEFERMKSFQEEFEAEEKRLAEQAEIDAKKAEEAAAENESPAEEPQAPAEENRKTVTDNEYVNRGGVVGDAKSNGISEENHSLLDSVGQQLGVVIEFVDRDSINGANGEWSTGENKDGSTWRHISIASDLSGDIRSALKVVFGHEATHNLRNVVGEDSQMWRDFVSTVRSFAGKKFDERFERYRKYYDEQYEKDGREKLSDDRIEEEVAVQYAGEQLMADEDFIRALIDKAANSTERPESIVQRMIDWSNQILSKLYQLWGHNPTSGQKATMDHLQAMRDAWSGMYEYAAAKNRKAGEQPAGTVPEILTKGLGEKKDTSSAAMKKARKDVSGFQDATDRLGMTEPETLEELAADMLSHGYALIEKDVVEDGNTLRGIRSMSGFGAKDLSGMRFNIRTRENGGLSVAEFGEQLMSEARNRGIMVDENDAMQGVNALQNLISETGGKGLGRYIENRRIDEAYRLMDQEIDAAGINPELASETGEHGQIEDNLGAPVSSVDNKSQQLFSFATFEPWEDNFGNKHNGTRYEVEKFMKDNGFSEEERKKLLDTMDYWYDYLKKVSEMTDEDGHFRFNAFREWNQKHPLYKQVGRNVEKAISSRVQNGEYANNLELTTDCIKREAFTQMLNTLVKRGVDMSRMGPREITIIQDLMKRHGLQVACPLCFVEGKRLGIVNWAQTIVDDWNDALLENQLKLDDLEEFGFGKDGDEFVPSEEYRAMDSADAQTRAYRAIQNVYNLLTDPDTAYAVIQRRAKAKAKAVRKTMEKAWMENPRNRKAIAEGKKFEPNPEQAKVLREIEREGHYTQRAIVRNTSEYEKAFKRMAEEWYNDPKNSKKIENGVVFEPTKKQWSELDKIRNREIDTIKSKMARLIAEHPEMRKKMSLKDLLGSKGLMEIRQQNGEAYAQLYSLILGRFGSGTPKPVQDAVPYDSEVIGLSPTVIKAADAEGGSRMFSFSDFDITKAFDYMQIFFDLAARGTKLQSYTKEAGYVLLAGKTGAKINMSTLPKAVVSDDVMERYRNAKSDDERKAIQHEAAEYAGLIVEDGEIKDMSWSEEHSLRPDFCKEIFTDPDYNGNVGATTVGASVNHSIWAAAQPWIRQVIPFHLSGMPKAARERTDVNWYNDATEYQNTRVNTAEAMSHIPAEQRRMMANQDDYAYTMLQDADGNWASIHSDYAKKHKNADGEKYSDFNFYEGEDNEGWDMRQRVRDYIRWCVSKGYRPKFQWGINSDEYRKYCEREGYTPNRQIIDMMDSDMTDGVWNGYYKFITDFTAYKPVFDESGNMIGEESSPHRPVKANFDLSDLVKDVMFGKENSMLANREANIQHANNEMNIIADEVSEYLSGGRTEEQMVGDGVNRFQNKADADLYLDRKAGDKRYSVVTPDMDAEFDKAVEAGDEEKARKMVEQVANAQGYTIHAYHGTNRSDRVGNVFRPERATSGPMAFFTDDKAIADNYSKNKKDTSLVYDSDDWSANDYHSQFHVNVGGYAGDVRMDKAWGYLSMAERRDIEAKARQLRTEWNDDLEDDEIIADHSNRGGMGDLDFKIKDNRGNVIKALVDEWLDSGNLFRKEVKFMEVLEKAGILDAFEKHGWTDARYMDPDFEAPKTYDVYLKIEKPFDTSTMYDEKFVDGLEKWWNRLSKKAKASYERESMDADHWDKNAKDIETWIEDARRDLKNGDSWAWTIIPDAVTDYLKKKGYDGIADRGGKGGGIGHNVFIPFTGEQVKSAEGITRDDDGNPIKLSERFNPNKDDIRYSYNVPEEEGRFSEANISAMQILHPSWSREQVIDELERMNPDKPGKDSISEENSSGYRLATDTAMRIVQDAIGADNVVLETQEAGQNALAQGGVEMMGSTVRKRQRSINDAFHGRELDSDDSVIVSVFSGRENNRTIVMRCGDGETRSFLFRQGSERNAGAKHSVYRHYLTRENYYTPEELLYVSKALKNGERVIDDNGRASYTIEDNGVRYTVTTEKKQGKELFTNFFTNRKPADSESASYTENQHMLKNQSVSSAKLQQNNESSKQNTEFLQTPSGVVYGWTKDGKIHITPEGINPETPIHEYTHLWSAAVRQRNPELWNDVKRWMKEAAEWGDVVDDQVYARIRNDEDAVASEVLSRLTGREGAKRLSDLSAKAMNEPNASDRERMTSVIDKLREAISKFWSYVSNDIFHMDHFNSAEDIPMQVLSDLVNKTDISSGTSFGDSVEEFEARVQDSEYMKAVKSGDMEKAQQMVNEKADRVLNETLRLPDDSNEMGFKYHKGPAPKKTRNMYAVFNVSEDGFRAAYAGNKNPTPVGVWIDAVPLKAYKSDTKFNDDGSPSEYVAGDTGKSWKEAFSEETYAKMMAEDPSITKGTRWLYSRGGKHGTDVPNFSQMNTKTNEAGEKVSKASEGALPHNKLLFEIECGMDEDGDLTEYVKENGRFVKQKNQGLDWVGTNKFYFFKTNPNAVGNWGIAGTFRIKRLVPQDEIESVTAQFKQESIDEANRLFDEGDISRKDRDKRIENANKITVQKWVGGYHPEDSNLTVESVDEMYREGKKRKLMDAVTYDDNGNVIPLSKRFDMTKDDSRYALRVPGDENWPGLFDEKQPTLFDHISEQREQVNVAPTEAQKKAGNYRMGHVKLDGYDVTLENPKGSTRSGKDASGKAWSITMNNDYGYIRGTEGVDGDHIDVFLSDRPDSGNVYVVDQINPDGSFDEHKVMYGFDSEEEARAAYLSNYSKGWKGLGNITAVTKDEFKKWVNSSHRKTKPFADYRGVKKIEQFREDSPEYANVQRIEEIESRIGDIDARMEQIGPEGRTIFEEAERISLEHERVRLQAELGGLNDINSQSRRIMSSYSLPVPGNASSYNPSGMPAPKPGETQQSYASRLLDYYQQAEAFAPENLTERDQKMKEAKDSVIRLITDAMKDEHIGSMSRGELARLLSNVRNARPGATLNRVLASAEETVTRVKFKAQQRQIEDTLRMKVQDVNGKNMSVAKNVNDSTRRVFTMLRGRISDMQITGYDEDMTYLRRDNRYRQDQISKLERQIENMGWGADEIQDAREQIEAHKAVIEENKAEIGRLNELKEEVKAAKVNAEHIDVDEAIRQLEEKMDKAAHGEEQWTQNDAEQLTAFTIRKRNADIYTKAVEIKKLREKIGVLEQKASELWEQYKNETDDVKRQRLRIAGRGLRQQIDGIQLMINDAMKAQTQTQGDVINLLNELVSGGKDSLLQRVESEAKRRAWLIKSSYADVKDKDIDIFDKDAGTEHWAKRFFAAPLGSFEYMAQVITRNKLGKDGFFYKHFVEGDDGVIASNNNYLKGFRAAMDTMDGKCRELFGKGFKDVTVDNDKVVDASGVHVMQYNEDGSLGEMYELPLSKGQATYLYMVWKMTDGRAHMENQGFNEESMREIETFIGEANRKWADWIQGEYLPDLRQKYNDRYLEMYNTSLAEVENYVPLRIRKESTRQESQLSDDSAKKKSIQERAGSLINRTHNLNPIDITQSAFDVILDHVNQMEEWNAFARVRKDLDGVLSDTRFRNQLNANSRGQFDKLMDAAAVATHAHHPDPAKYMDQVLGKVSKGIVGANIGFRYTTALKQTLSAPAFFGYSNDPKFIAMLAKNIGVEYAKGTGAFAATALTAGVAGKKMFEAAGRGESVKGLSKTIRWAMENIPDFRERVLRATSGNEKLDEEGLSKRFDSLLNYGMVANQLVDAVTCSIGIKTIYDYKHDQLLKAVEAEFKKRKEILEQKIDAVNNATLANVSPEKTEKWRQERTREMTEEYERDYQKAIDGAHNKAIMDADIYYNGTQQSNHMAFMSPMQMSRTLMDRMLTTYQNASIGYARKFVTSVQDLKRSANWKKMVQNYAEQYAAENPDMSYEDAERKAKAHLISRNRNAFISSILYGAVLNWIWDMGGRGLLGLFRSDDDNDKLWSVAEAMSLPGRGLPGMNTIVSLAQGDNGNPLLLYDELSDIVKASQSSIEDGTISNELLWTMMQKSSRMTGLDMETWSNIYLGLEGMVRDGVNMSGKDALLEDMMFFLNTPRTNRVSVVKQLYKDEPKELFVEHALRASKYLTNPWESWMPNAKAVTQKKVNDIVKEFDLLNMTPEERRQVEEKEDLKKAMKKSEDIMDLMSKFDGTDDVELKKTAADRIRKLLKEGDTGAMSLQDMIDKASAEKTQSEGQEENKRYLKAINSDDLYDDMIIKEGMNALKAIDDTLTGYEKNRETDKAKSFMMQHQEELKAYDKLKGLQSAINGDKDRIGTGDDEKALNRIRSNRRHMIAIMNKIQALHD